MYLYYIILCTLMLNKIHTYIHHCSFKFLVLNLWNSLPRNIQEITSLSSIKSALFRLLGAKPQF